MIDNRKKNIAIIWVALFIVSAGMSAIVPFLPLFIRELGVTDYNEVAAYSGMCFSAPFLISFFVTPFWGILGDKYGKKLMTVRAIFGLAVALVLIGISQNVYQLLVFRILQGLLSGFYPASIALAAADSPPEKTAQTIGAIQSSNISGNIIGPLIGGTLSDLFGFRWVFIIVGILSAVMGVLIVSFVKNDKPKQTKDIPKYLDNWKLVLHNKLLLLFGLTIVLASFGDSFIRPIFVLFVESLGVNKSSLATISGLLLSIQGFSAALSAGLLSRVLVKRHISKVLAASFIIVAAANLAQGYLSSLMLVALARFVIGLAYGLVLPILYSLMIGDVDKSKNGGIVGISSSFQTLGNFVGPVSAGFLLSVAGFRGSFQIAASIFMLLSFVYVLKNTQNAVNVQPHSEMVE